MNPEFTSWIAPIAAAKEAAKASGQIKGDADLAAAVSEILETNGLKGVDRGAVNHWLKGRNPPSIVQFLALCKALGLNPSTVFGGGIQRLPTSPDKQTAEAISIMAGTDELGRTKALVGMKVALDGHKPESKKTA